MRKSALAWLPSSAAPPAHGRSRRSFKISTSAFRYGWSPEEIHWQHPNLSLAQIYAALAYYHDHRVSMAAEIHNSLESANAASRVAADSPLARRLRGFLTE